MSETNLLVRIYSEEGNGEGISTLRRLFSAAEDLELVVFTGGRKHKSSGSQAIAHISQPFNLVEGALKIRGRRAKTRLDIRYRPAISSSLWDKLDLTVDEPSLQAAVSEVHSKMESEDFQFLLSLKSFESASCKSNNTNVAVLEALHYSIPLAETPEKTILRSFENSFPELLDREMWGYADVVPFRSLSISQEWEAAVADTLWPDLSISADAQHQYVFTTSRVKTLVKLPAKFTQEKQLTIYSFRGIV